MKEVQEVTKVEQEFYHFMNDKSGSFTTNLFKTIMCASIVNKSKLWKSFPQEVEVVNKYTNEEGYWNASTHNCFKQICCRRFTKKGTRIIYEFQ
jgi:hypothetical protein